MAWEISHSEQARANVRARLVREWGEEQLIDALMTVHRDKLENASHDALVKSVMDTIREHNTCSNGGHVFYIDREGYHTVSCSPPNEGTCGACKCDVTLVREIPEKGEVELSCGCTTLVKAWTSEE